MIAPCAINSSGVDNSTSSSMGNLGSINSRGINRDNSSVSVGNKTMWVSSIADRDDMSKVSKVSSSGSSNSGSVSGDNSSVGESNQSSG